MMEAILKMYKSTILLKTQVYCKQQLELEGAGN